MICTACNKDETKGQRLPGGAFVCKSCTKKRRKEKKG